MTEGVEESNFRKNYTPSASLHQKYTRMYEKQFSFCTFFCLFSPNCTQSSKGFFFLLFFLSISNVIFRIEHRLRTSYISGLKIFLYFLFSLYFFFHSSLFYSLEGSGLWNIGWTLIYI